MAIQSNYSTIQQHQPFRVPSKWDKQERMFIVQLEETLDDIYRRFGRLRLQDMGKEFQTAYADLNGNVADLTITASEIGTRMTNAEGDISSLRLTAQGIEADVSNLEGDITSLQVTAQGLETRISNAEGDITTIEATATGLATRITNAEGDISSLSQTADSIAARVTNNEGSIAQLNLTASGISSRVTAIDQRISSLGYGTIYMQPDEPSHSQLVQGDIWVQSMPQGTWQSVSEDYASWQTIKDSVGTWQTLGGIPKMFVWDGRYWQEMYDAALSTTLQTEIEQLADQIALRATTSQVDAMGNRIDLFSAELTVQSQQIQAAVSAVNTKASSYVMMEDPRTEYTVSLGDIWIKSDTDTSSWSAVRDSYSSWQEIKDTYESWERVLGAITYVWNGTKWVETSDRASEINQKTLITQTATEIRLLATQQANFQGELVSLSAALTIAADRISAEVTRATNAENSKIAKTSQYQTADAIVSEAVSQASSSASGAYIAKTSVYQTAQSIVAAAEEYTANNAYIIKSGIAINASGIEVSGGKYVRIKSGGSFSVDSGNFSIDTSGNVTVSGKITAGANSMIGGWTLGSNILYSGSEAGYVALDSNSSDTYAIWAGAASAASAPFSVKRNGEITAKSGVVGGWSIGNSLLASASGAGYVALDGNTSDTYAMWAGSEAAGSAPFRVQRDGTVVMKSLQVAQEDGTVTTVDLSNQNSSYPLWKLYYHTIRRYTTDSITLSNGATLNFNKAVARLAISGDPSATATILAVQVWFSDTYYQISQLNVADWKTDVLESVQPSSWNISYTAAGANVTVLLNNGKSYTHFFAD